MGTFGEGQHMPQAGWYDDPQDAAQLRYWDGERWTDQRQPREATPPPPPQPGASDQAAGASAPSDPWDVPVHERGTPWGGSDGGAAARSATLLGAAPPRTFIEAIKVCLTKYVDGKGRASRSEYWYFALFTFLIDAVTGGLAVIVLLLPSITVTVRRLHDIGKSAWALLWLLVPFVGLVVLIVYTVRPGEPNVNVYG